MNAVLFEELRRLIARHGRSEGCPHEALPSLMLASSRAPTSPTGYIAGAQFVLVAEGAKEIKLGKKIYKYGPGQYMVVSVDLPLQASVIKTASNASFLCLCLTLNRDVIAELLLASGSAVPSLTEREPLSVGTITDDLLDPIVRLLRLLDRPEDLKVLADNVQREITWRLIRGPHGRLVCQLGLADSRIVRVGEALRWIRERYREEIRVDDLAQIARMSPTSFHRHFRTFTTMTPIQYQKEIRLQIARTRLVGGEDNVARVGFAVGFNSPSQFSREYRRLFGHSPILDARPVIGSRKTKGL